MWSQFWSGKIGHEFEAICIYSIPLANMKFNGKLPIIGKKTGMPKNLIKDNLYHVCLFPCLFVCLHIRPFVSLYLSVRNLFDYVCRRDCV